MRRSAVVIPLALASALWLRSPARAEPCRPVEIRIEPDRAPVDAAKADAVTPRQTPREILDALGPAHRDHCSAPRHCLEWFLADARGLRIDFADPCRPAEVFHREGAHSVRRAELAGRAGLWVVPQSQVDALNAGLAAQGLKRNFGGPDPFYFDGETITLGFTPFFSYQSMAENRPVDDIYCEATKWVGDDLFLLTPEDPHWALHMSFRDGQFEESLNTQDSAVGIIVWRYERIPPEQAGRYERQLLAPRLRWSYALNRESETMLCHP